MSHAHQVARRTPWKVREWKITDRRKEVLHWMARGKSNSEIAEIMSLSPLTVKNHVEQILVVYGATNRICAAMRAMARGDISTDALMQEFA